MMAVRVGVDDGSSRGGVPVVVLAAVTVVASAASMSVSGPAPGTLAISLAFGAFVALGEVLRVGLSGDRSAAPLAAAGSLAFALLTQYEGVDVTYGIAQVVVVTTLALAVGSVPHLATGRGPRVEEFARRVLVTALIAVLFRPLLDAGLLPHQPTPALAMAMVLVALLGAVADALLAAIVRASRDHAPLRTTFPDELRALVGMGSAVGATGILIALATPLMGLWALPVFAMPLLLTWFAFRRYAGIRRTYSQTIRALARVTEVGGYSETGHARRVTALSIAVGREMGLSEAQLVDLEYAALLHDIGQLSLPEPIPGGATTMVPAAEQRRIAELGAAVVRQTGVLDRVAEIVERQADAYRPGRDGEDAGLPLESRVIRAANAFDDLVGASLESDRRLQALERLHLDTAREFDPRVVATLSRVVERSLDAVA